MDRRCCNTAGASAGAAETPKCILKTSSNMCERNEKRDGTRPERSINFQFESTNPTNI